MPSNTTFLHSGWPIVKGLNFLGNKLTLVVLRDLHWGKKTYTQLAGSPEKTPTNRLAERLKKLQIEGVLEKKPYQSRPPGILKISNLPPEYYNEHNLQRVGQQGHFSHDARPWSNNA